jgi:hypothetical protein
MTIVAWITAYFAVGLGVLVLVDRYLGDRAPFDAEDYYATAFWPLVAVVALRAAVSSSERPRRTPR